MSETDNLVRGLFPRHLDPRRIHFHVCPRCEVLHECAGADGCPGEPRVAYECHECREDAQSQET